MKSLPLIALLFVASPALGQSRVYSNADLGTKLSAKTVTSPAAALETWLTHTGGVPPPLPVSIGTWVGPTAVIITSSTGARTIPWEQTYAGRQAIQAEQDLEITSSGPGWICSSSARNARSASRGGNAPPHEWPPAAGA